MDVRLNKFLAHAGVCSRREADRFIETGRVRVNGLVVDELGLKIDPSRDRVDVDGRKVRPAQEKPVYLLLYKPRGSVVTVKDPFGRPTVMDLLPKLATRIYPVGRLDADSEGALLFTNDGDTAYRLTHPKHEIGKTYDVRIEGEPAAEDLDKLRHGIFLEGRRTAPSVIRVVKRLGRRTILRVQIREGRKREIRKMFEALGHPVERLLRVDFAGLTLAGLKSGQWRQLTAKEAEKIRAMGR